MYSYSFTHLGCTRLHTNVQGFTQMYIYVYTCIHINVLFGQSIGLNAHSTCVDHLCEIIEYRALLTKYGLFWQSIGLYISNIPHLECAGILNLNTYILIQRISMHDITFIIWNLQGFTQMASISICKYKYMFISICIYIYQCILQSGEDT